MKAGVQFFPTAEAMSPVAFACAAEERGFESVFFPDHTHVPVEGAADSPEFYRTVMDPLMVLAAVAAATSRIGIGTAVCLVPQRDPIVLAKQVATLDQLSGGRLLFGVGAGSNDAELRNHGTDPARRFAVLRERVEAMTAIWTQEEASYQGEHVRFEAIWSWPEPVQRPRPPVLVGGTGPTVLDRVLAYGDGWFPFRPGTEQVGRAACGEPTGFDAELEARVRELERRAAAAGRDPIPVTLFNPLPHQAALARYREMGVARVVFWLPAQNEPAMVRTLDALEELVMAA